MTILIKDINETYATGVHYSKELIINQYQYDLINKGIELIIKSKVDLGEALMPNLAPITSPYTSHATQYYAKAILMTHGYDYSGTVLYGWDDKLNMKISVLDPN